MERKEVRKVNQLEMDLSQWKSDFLSPGTKSLIGSVKKEFSGLESLGHDSQSQKINHETTERIREQARQDNQGRLRVTTASFDPE